MFTTQHFSKGVGRWQLVRGPGELAAAFAAPVIDPLARACARRPDAVDRALETTSLIIAAALTLIISGHAALAVML